MNGLKVFKKGEVIFKEGDRVTSVYLLQSGTVFLQFLRGKQKIDFHQASPHMILGEYGLSGQQTHPATAITNAEVKAIEIPLDALKSQIESHSQITKAIIKGFVDKLKVMSNDLKSSRLERDSSPCPPDQTAKIFGTIWHVANHKGEKKSDRVVVSWGQMKTYAQRVFMESPKRLEQAISIFVKLKLAEFQMVKNEEDPDAPDELGFIHFFDLLAIEEFFEYYQFYFFKSGKADLLKTDDTAMTIVAGINALAAKSEPDRHGVVRLDYTKVVETLATEYGLQLKADHFSLLEMKGLFCKRQSTDNGVLLHVEVKEFARVFRIWLVLREIGKWNEKGVIDMRDEWKPQKKVMHNGPICPECEAHLEKEHKFCPSCGHKITAAA